jgi:hypothetical protein
MAVEPPDIDEPATLDDVTGWLARIWIVLIVVAGLLLLLLIAVILR